MTRIVRYYCRHFRAIISEGRSRSDDGCLCLRIFTILSRSDQDGEQYPSLPGSLIVLLFRDLALGSSGVDLGDAAAKTGRSPRSNLANPAGRTPRLVPFGSGGFHLPPQA